MPGQVDRDRVGHQLVQRDVVQAGAAGGQVRRRIHVRAGAVGERVLRPRVAVRRRVGKVAELRRRDARHDGHPVGHGVRQVDDLHLQRLSRRELATSRWKRLDRRIAHAEQARLACPAGQWPPRDTEVAETAAPAPRCASRPSPRTHGTAGAAAAYHKSPGSGWHDDELGGHMYATVAEPHEQDTDFQPADAGALRCHDRGTSARCMQHRALVARGAQASRPARAARARSRKPPGTPPRGHHQVVGTAPEAMT